MNMKIDLGIIILCGVILWMLTREKAEDIEFWTDPGTACEYLISPNGTLVPRIDSAYMHGGCDPQEDY